MLWSELWKNCLSACYNNKTEYKAIYTLRSSLSTSISPAHSGSIFSISKFVCTNLKWKSGCDSLKFNENRHIVSYSAASVRAAYGTCIGRSLFISIEICTDLIRKHIAHQTQYVCLLEERTTHTYRVEKEEQKSSLIFHAVFKLSSFPFLERSHFAEITV